MERDENSGFPGGADSGPMNWTLLVDRIRAGDSSAMEDLYNLFARGVRFYLYRQLGAQELEDKIHDTFLIVVQAIRRGDLREPDRLMGFVRTVVRRQVAASIDEMVHVRREETPLESGIPVADHAFSPEERVISQEEVDVATRTLRSMRSRDREILTRFYLQEQTQEQICREMGLTETQFRLMKSRAKAKFGEIGRRRIEKKPAGSIFVRTFTAFRH